MTAEVAARCPRCGRFTAVIGTTGSGYCRSESCDWVSRK